MNYEYDALEILSTTKIAYVYAFNNGRFIVENPRNRLEGNLKREKIGISIQNNYKLQSKLFKAVVIIDESEKLFIHKSFQLFSFLTIDNENVHNCLHIKVYNSLFNSAAESHRGSRRY